jgi:hypothetical protein
MLTELAGVVYPKLILEHCWCCSPLNDITLDGDSVGGSGAFAGTEACLQYEKLLPFSPVIRTYDTIAPMFIATTLDRTAELLKRGSTNQRGGLLCTEDPVYLGTSLGCSLGIMRSPRWLPNQSEQVAQRAKRIYEVIRAVRVQRIAPAYPISAGSLEISRQRLTDRWLFAPGSTWLSGVFEKEITQSAPASIARNCSLPHVVPKELEAPFVTVSLHPNGTLTAAILPRLLTGKGFYTPKAAISFETDCRNRKCVIFGKFASVSFPYSGVLQNLRVWAQDPAGETALDISSQVSKTDGCVTISGDILPQVCSNPTGDVSDPAMILFFEDN